MAEAEKQAPQVSGVPAEGREQREDFDIDQALTLQIQGLDRSIGKVDPLPEAISIMDVKTSLSDLDQQTINGSFAQVMRRNELKFREKALQLLNLKQLKSNSGTGTEDWLTANKEGRAELSVANQAVTYYAYLPAVINQVKNFLEAFDQSTREMMPDLPEAQRMLISEQRRMSVEYIQVLRSLIDERKRYADVRQIDIHLADLHLRSHQPDQPAKIEALTKLRAEIITSMSPESQKFFADEKVLLEQFQASKTPDEAGKKSEEIRKNMNSFSQGLEEKLITVLKGNPAGENIPGAPKDFLPQRLYLQVMQLRYEQLQGIQIEISHQNDWSDPDKMQAQKHISALRRNCISEIGRVTQHLIAHQVATAELTSIQGHFAGNYDLLIDPGRPSAKATAEDVRTHVAKSIDGAKDFHLERLEDMLKTVGSEFDPNGLVALKDASAMQLVKGLDGVSRFMRNSLTFLLPQGKYKESIDKWLDEKLPFSIAESLDTGFGPDGKPMTREQKLTLLRDIFVKFRDGRSAQKFSETIGVLKALPPAGNFVAEDVQKEVVANYPGGRITTNIIGTTVVVDGQSVTINGPTAYVLTIRQMQRDNEVFADQYGTMLGDMEDLVDIRLGLRSEAKRISESWGTLLETIAGTTTAATITLWIAGLSAGTLALKAARPVVGTLLHPVRTVQNISSLPGRIAGKVTPDRLMLSGMAAGQAYRTYEDFLELGDISRSVETQRTKMITELRVAGFEADPKEQEAIFVYKDGDLQIKVNIEEIKNALGGQTTAQGVRTGADALELVYLLNAIRVGTSAARAVPVVAAVEVTVETVVYGMNQQAQRNFIKKCPSWLLAKINMKEAVKESRYDVLAKASEWMLTDPLYWFGKEEAGENRKMIREKMVFGLLHDELAVAPGLLKELYPSGPHPKEMQKFEEGDFRDVFLKFYYVALFSQCKGALSFDQVRQGNVGGGTVLPVATPDIPELNVRKAIREALVLTVENRKEREFLAVSQRRITAGDDPQTDLLVYAFLQQAEGQLGERTSLGQRVGQLPRNPDGRTRLQVLADQAVDAARSGNFVHSEGLTAPLNLADLSNVLDQCVTDPALRMRLLAVKPRTIDEREGAEGRLWHNWKFWSEPIGQAFGRSIADNTRMGAYGNIDFPRSFAIGAADNIRSELGRQKIAPIPTAWSILGAAGDEVTLDKAQDHITLDSVDLVELSETAGKQRSRFEASEATSQRLFPGLSVPVFTESGRDMGKEVPIERLKYKFDQLDQKKFGPPRAMFLEHRTLSKSGHQMVLATCVYGDLSKKEAIVVQCAMATSMLARTSKEYAVGSLHPASLDEMRGKAGMELMLEKAVEAQKEQEKVMERRRIESQLSQARYEAAAQETQRQQKDPDIARENIDTMLKKASTDRFTQVPDRWGGTAWRMKYVDPATKKEYLVRLDSFTAGPAFSAVTTPKDGRQSPSAGHLFVLENEHGDSIRITSADFMDQEDLSDERKRLMQAIVTTPIQHEAGASLDQVLDLFPFDNYISMIWANHFYKGEMREKLQGLYNATPTFEDSQNFLRELFVQLKAEGAITKKSVTKIVGWFNANKGQFHIPE